MSERPQVVWIGSDPPGYVVEEFKRRNLQVLVGGMELRILRLEELRTRGVVAAFMDSPRAVHRRTLSKFLADSRSNVEDHGGLLVIAALDITSFGRATVAVRSLFSEKDTPSVRVFPLYRRSAIRDPIEDAATLAQVFAEHSAGPTAGPQTEIRGLDEVPETDHFEIETLLRRAFADFRRVDLTRLTGGLAASYVWRVSASDSRGLRAVPFVAKAASRDEIQQEIAQTHALVEDYVPFPHRPPLAAHRCVRGSNLALLVSHFAERAERLDKFLAHGSVIAAIASLFDGPLRIWRANARSEAPIQLGEHYIERRVLPGDVDWRALQIAYEDARTEHSVRSPSELRSAILALPRTPVWVCRAHGDLHSKNVFVRQQSTDSILIDFAKTTDEDPMSRDPAQLDVTLGLDTAITDTGPLSLDLLRQLYAWPVVPMLPSLGGDPRVDAVRQVRTHARGGHLTDDEYRFSVLVFLIWLAKAAARTKGKPVDPGALKARWSVAYFLADELLSGILSHAS